MKAALSIAAALTLAAASGNANAWFKVQNSTPNTVYFVHAYAAVFNVGLNCGYNDGCPWSPGYPPEFDWRYDYWFAIAPGGVVQVHGAKFYEAAHQFYADDDFGNFWAGDGWALDVYWEGAMGCIGFPESGTLYGNVGLRRLRDQQCCAVLGQGCSPENYTINLTW